MGEGLPECRRIDDRNALDLAEAEKVGVTTDDVVGAAGDRALEELVVGRIPTHTDRDIGPDQHGMTPETDDHRARFARRHAELAQQFGARDDRLDLGEDRVGNEQSELTDAPGFVDARREALGARERASQEYLRVKNDSGLGQRAPPRR